MNGAGSTLNYSGGNAPLAASNVAGETPVSKATDQIGANIENAHQLITQLETRLAHYLADPPQQPSTSQTGNGKDEQVLSGFHSRVLHQRNNAILLCERIAQLTSRLTI